MELPKNCSMLTGTQLIAWFLFLIVHITSVIVIQGEEHFYDFVVSEKNFTKLCETKSILVVNGGFPGPEIRVHKGDTVFVNVQNQGDYGFTIHWHGIKQPRNPWFDGPEYITQCPITPGSNFTYVVNLSDEEGTLWWHAHSDWTRATVHGAIVILPAEGTTFPFPEPDDDETIIIASWYTADVNELVDTELKQGTNVMPISDAYTINGEAGDLCPCSNETTYRRMVDYGKTYLLRLINVNMDAEVFFAVAGHNLSAVGLDAAYIKPINTSYIVISPGQTMDILLHANQSPGRYYMAGRRFASDDANVTGTFDKANVTAILEYSGNYTYQTSPLFPTTLPMYHGLAAAREFIEQIRSLASLEHPVDVPLDITTRMFITVSMNELHCTHPGCTSDWQMTSTVNNISWANPAMDILHAYYKNISGFYTSDFPDEPTAYYNFTEETYDPSIVFTDQGTKVKVLEYNETVEIVFQGTNVIAGSINHAMHMHGYSFYVVGGGFGNYDNETDPQGFNLIDPPAVNTFPVPKIGWLAIRFRANNPGVWFWHCHLEKHLSWGMGAAFIVKNGGTVETSIHQPPAYMPPCEVPLDSRTQNNDTNVQ